MKTLKGLSKLLVSGITAGAIALSGLTGCASPSMKYYDRDFKYDKKPGTEKLFEYPGYCFLTSADDLSEGRYLRGLGNIAGGILSGVNDVVETPFRGVGYGVKKATERIPFVRGIGEGLDCVTRETFDVLPGGRTNNETIGSSGNFTEGDWHDKFIFGAVTRPYKNAWEDNRADIINCLEGTGKLVGVYGSWSLFIAGGGAGGGGGAEKATNPGPGPF